MKLVTLRKRREFLRVRGGRRWSGPAFVLEAKPRVSGSAQTGTAAADVFTGPRFGFTVTKRIGNAVTRNRVRRRLREALCQVANRCSRDHLDYVVVARDQAKTREFKAIITDFERAFDHVHKPGKPTRSRRNGDQKPRSKRPSAMSDKSPTSKINSKT